MERGDPQHDEFSRVAAEHILEACAPGSGWSFDPGRACS